MAAKPKRTKRGRTDGREGFMIYLSEEEKAELLAAQGESSYPTLAGFIRATALEVARRHRQAPDLTKLTGLY